METKWIKSVNIHQHYEKKNHCFQFEVETSINEMYQICLHSTTDLSFAIKFYVQTLLYCFCNKVYTSYKKLDTFSDFSL